MKVDEKRICRLCFNITNDEFNEIDDIMGHALEVMLLEMDLNITENPMICQTCTRIIKGLLYFKLVCLHNEKLILSFSINEKEAKFELMDVVHKKRDTEMAVEDNFRCRFCMNGIKNNDFVTMDILMQKALYKDMLPVFMPEMDFSIVGNPIICTSCKENLDCYFKLIKDCLDGVNGRSGIKDSNVLHFPSSNQFRAEKCKWTQSNKRQSTISKYSCELTKIEEIFNIKDEGELLNEDSCERQSPNDNRYSYSRNDNPLQNNICSDSDTNSYNIFIHKTKQTQSWDRNKVDKVKHKCTLCTYTAKYKCSMQDHMVNHKDPTEVDMYKCSRCLYRTKRKGDLKQHMLVHKDASEVKMYKCDSCAYMTKYKGTLQQHALTHKDASEVEIYRCSQCLYETKCKRYLKSHMIVHRTAGDIYMYKCALCPHKTKIKANLKRHMLVHKDASEVEMYKCEFCAYSTKYKCSLQQHVLTHKDASEVEMYRCSHCPYETTCKHYLKSHMVIHRSDSEGEIYKCGSCVYTTKSKRALQQHTLTHKTASEVKMHKCSLCPYETKWRNHLKRHVISHKDVSELEMYKCFICDYECKYKQYIKRHMLSHKDASELKTYKCSVCGFGTKYQNNLTRHMLTHAQ